MRSLHLSAAAALTLLYTMSPAAQAQTPVASGNIWIGGTAAGSVWTGEPYLFKPSVYSRTGVTPTRFGVINLPQWATLGRDGTLSGTPGPQHVGTYDGIHLIVYVGGEYAMLGPLSILVRDTSTSPRVTLSWQAPRQNVDGSPLTDLGGYRIFAARQGSVLQEVKRIADPQLTRVVIDKLDAGTWFFQVTALTDLGVQSEPTRMVWKQVR